MPQIVAMQVNAVVSDTDFVTVRRIRWRIWKDSFMKKIWMLSDNPAFFSIKKSWVNLMFMKVKDSSLTHLFQYASDLTWSSFVLSVMGVQSRQHPILNGGSIEKWMSDS